MKTNILLITSDQQHWHTLGRNNPKISTPNLDRLAAMGTTFERAYCPNPTCSPTRASILTGKYPSQHGCYALGTKLPESEETVGDLFLDAGYRTALIGKAHLQPLRSTDAYRSIEAYPTLQDLAFWQSFDDVFYGFEHVELARNHTDEAHVGQHYALWLEEQGCHNWRDYFRPPTGNNDSQKRKWLIPEKFHYGTWIAERTMARLTAYAESEENFFLWASFFDPHPDYLVPEPWDKMYDPAEIDVPQIHSGEHSTNPPHFQLTQMTTPDFSAWDEPDGHSVHGFHSHLQNPAELAKDIAIYYGMVSLMDKQIGQILDHLDAVGLLEHTLVVFTSDHGHLFGQHGLIAKGPFHYEDLLRVPMIVSMPNRVPANRYSSSLQSLVDLAPTFLRFADMPIPRAMSGIDQSLVWQSPDQQVRDHVLVENHHQPTTLNLRTYVDAHYKLTVYMGHDYGELFDLDSDPAELNNLWLSERHQSLKQTLLLKMVQADMARETTWMPRIIQA
ncbi:MAG: sulfatase-like hydrolase/transferase [Chloroflexota bacterium]